MIKTLRLLLLGTPILLPYPNDLPVKEKNCMVTLLSESDLGEIFFSNLYLINIHFKNFNLFVIIQNNTKLTDHFFFLLSCKLKKEEGLIMSLLDELYKKNLRYLC